MIVENRQLVTNEPVEFEKQPVEVHECRKIIDPSRGSYRIYPNLIKENRRMLICNRSDLQTLESQPVIVPKNLSDHWPTQTWERYNLWANEFPDIFTH